MVLGYVSVGQCIGHTRSVCRVCVVCVTRIAQAMETVEQCTDPRPEDDPNMDGVTMPDLEAVPPEAGDVGATGDPDNVPSFDAVPGA